LFAAHPQARLPKEARKEMNQRLPGEVPGKTETGEEQRPLSPQQTVVLGLSLRQIVDIGRIADLRKRQQALIESGRQLGILRESD